ncbi:MAG: tellurite resistance TerB family protein [Albidovulum sp.]
MSFIKTLAVLATGFAAARGYDKYRKVGGMAGMKGSLENAGAEGGMVDQIGQMVEKLGVPGAAKSMRDMAAAYGPKAAEAGQAAEAGLGGLIGSMQGAVSAGAGAMGEMIATMTGASPMAAVAEENAKLLIRAMCQAAMADGEIDAEEKAKIMAHLADASDAERGYVQEQMAAPLDLEGLVAATGTGMAAQVYSSSLITIAPDKPVELAYLAALGEALGLDKATRDSLHAAQGMPPLEG